MSKSYWQSMVCDGPRSHEAIKSWLSPMCADMTPLKAEILCDIATDKEKKLRVLMQDKDGKKILAIRTFGRKFSITIKPSKAA